jgi:eukaryotic-like serine/threonine-protein kinase
MSDQASGEPPQIVGERYILGKCVGSGSSGSVYLARERDTGDRFAIKIREAKATEQPVRFIAEAQDMARLRHPRLVPVVDYGNDGQLYWYVMPYYSKGCVREQVKGAGSVSTHQALSWTFEILEGLSIVHKHGLVHRDVKPHNVLLDDADHAVLTDFGLVRHLHGGVPYRTRTDQSMGTPNYRAPEQAVDAANVDPRADLYGAGATLYYLLTARRPGFLYMVSADDPTMEAVPEFLRAFILKCMAYGPAERFADSRTTAVEVARLVDLDPARAGQPPVGPSWMQRFDRQDHASWWERFTSWFKW